MRKLKSSKLVLIALLLVSSMAMTSCNTPIENISRDSIAAAKGVIQAAQTHYDTHCQVDPDDRHCVLINDGVDVQNLAIDALILYCGSESFLDIDNPGICEPNKEFEPRLKESLKNMRKIITRIQNLLK